MNKPTSPGPWFLVAPSKMHGRQYKDWVITYGDGYNWVCLGPEWDPEFQEESDANGRLIAAAPDSHAANVKFVEAMGDLWNIKPSWSDDRIYDDLPSSGLAAAYFAARAAIAKVTGG